ncbi:MAG: alpha/beta fold hydrolase [Rhodospirillaceae bacterium]|jgi:pimeloyl-ACP methyl ester carboxylesterase|nr:alpha/beta fold hydrolase [Rhodospirillaceae bacterium]MBT7771904.1 alpha/beta fold hydrolase [Rhodospirillales bacterium]MBT4702963.1 alpha/beta fold hydrolase [Rhodospirillaceae bacterium]MBT5036317.1 alpha/beta fold hydrolase [Rhodospirillaceae bacterium]MBT6219587.1 alpha/beta fold hydrolase [Rhodospirillaceae bacterium]
MSNVNGSWTAHFDGNMMWSNAALVTKGMAPYGAVALGEIDQICERLRVRQDEPEAWNEEWVAMGERLEKVAIEAENNGHRMTAGNYFLRAGMYYFTGERFLYPGPEKKELGRKAIECQQAGILRRHPNVERVEVPYENTTLPALFMKAQGVSGPAPTIVVFDGMDNCKEMSILFAGLEFAARGWHTLCVDGPGQGETLRLQDLYARHDYEIAGAAAFDYLGTRAEVNAARVGVMGYSFGGYYAARIAAMEPRYKIGVAMSALHWDLAGWQQKIFDRQSGNATSTPQSAFHFRWIMGHLDDAQAAIEKAKKFSMVDLAPKMTTPFMIVHGDNDKVVPVASAHKLYEAIGSSNKALKILTSEDGGHYHAQADNRQVGTDVLADWIAENI